MVGVVGGIKALFATTSYGAGDPAPEVVALLENPNDLKKSDTLYSPLARKLFLANSVANGYSGSGSWNTPTRASREGQYG